MIKANKLQVAAVILHMGIMRKNLKKGLKRNHGNKEAKELINIFDQAKEKLEEALLILEVTPEEDTQEALLIFEQSELNILGSFLSWYVTEIEISYEVAGKHLHQEEKEQMELLKDFNKLIESVKEHE